MFEELGAVFVMRDGLMMVLHHQKCIFVLFICQKISNLLGSGIALPEQVLTKYNFIQLLATEVCTVLGGWHLTQAGTLESSGLFDETQTLTRLLTIYPQGEIGALLCFRT